MSEAAAPEHALALELRGITKRFGALAATESVDLDVRRGEVHALLGENGAGKSTLMNVVYGLHHPDAGEIRLRGEPVRIASPRQAIGMGIGMVHQHFMLIPVMTVAENIVLASEPRSGPLLDIRAAEARVRELSDRFGLRVDPSARVEELTVGEQQRVEILRALHRRADVLILDEPTAVLTAGEVADLFRVLKALTAEGVAIVFITHKLREVLEAADRITVLRRGRKIATVDAAGATEQQLAELMVGREVLFRLDKAPFEPARPLLEVEDLRVLDRRGLPAVDGVSFEVRSGEIVGIAGVDGNGQTELVEALTGLRRPEHGVIRVDGRDVTHENARGKLAARIGHIAEDRHRRGLVLDMSLAENLSLRDYRRAARWGLLSPRRMRERSQPLLEQYDVRGGGLDTPAAALSGGNQQKLVVARELAEDPLVLVAAQPTRGLDVGAIEFVHRRLLDQRAQGHAVLLVSFELDEIRGLADRVLVIYEGRVVAERAPDTPEDELGVLMTGGGRAEAA